MIETAFAKINLALHVRQRRADGYHQLETLFAFVDDGDILSVELADEDRLTISGEFAEGLSTGPDNLVMAALAVMRQLPGGGRIPPLALHLDKALPVAAGLGGGSADAGALVRLIHRNYLPQLGVDALLRATAHLGADIGACIISETRIGVGVGTELNPVAVDDCCGLPVLLVNPRIALTTGPVFAGWDGIDRGALTGTSARAIMLAGRNDLEAPALRLCPVIGDVLTVLHDTAPLLARMSGSGATCFALFGDRAARDAAAAQVASAHPVWWTLAGTLR